MVTVVLLKVQALWDAVICHWANCLSLLPDPEDEGIIILQNAGN